MESRDLAQEIEAETLQQVENQTLHILLIPFLWLFLHRVLSEHITEYSSSLLCSYVTLRLTMLLGFG